MIGDYKVSRSTRQCSLQNRPLKEGEWYYSAVVDGEENVQRIDISEAAWQGPPEGCIGYWKCRIPEKGQQKLVAAPKAVLVNLLHQMEDAAHHEGEQNKLRYLLALNLLRRRMVRLAESHGSDSEPKMLAIVVDSEGTLIEIPECQISRDESELLSEALSELLYCEESQLEALQEQVESEAAAEQVNEATSDSAEVENESDTGEEDDSGDAEAEEVEAELLSDSETDTQPSDVELADKQQESTE